VRKGDGDARDFHASRENRLQHHDGVWFFRSREGLKGPYPSRRDAEQTLATYIETMEYLEDQPAPDNFDPTDVTIIRLDDEDTD